MFEKISEIDLIKENTELCRVLHIENLSIQYISSAYKWKDYYIIKYDYYDKQKSNLIIGGRDYELAELKRYRKIRISKNLYNIVEKNSLLKSNCYIDKICELYLFIRVKTIFIF